MKKIIYLIAFTTIFFSSCKKDKNEPASDNTPTLGGSSTNTIPAYVQPQAGSLKVNVNSLIMHPGDNVTLIASLYNANGTVASTSGLIWNSSNSGIANVNNGIVTANTIGNCEVTVTDGIHGLLIVNISIVSNTTSITNTPTSICFSLSGCVLAMPTNSVVSVSNYTVYNSQGIAVFPALTFIPPANSGLMFSGNTVTSGSVIGSFNVKVKAGNDTLTNTLNVVVLNTDTVYSFDIVQGSLARVFYKNNVASANPVIINVKKCWLVGSTPTFSNYITSPDKIEIVNNEDGIILNSSGKLESVKSTHYLEGALLKISYKNAYLYRGVSVAINLTNTWGVTLSNGDSYNYCITQTGPDVYYNSNEYFLNTSTQFLSGSYLVMESGAQVFYGSDNLFTGTYNPSTLAFVGSQCVSLRYSGQVNPEIYNMSNDGNHLSKAAAGSNPNLQRGTGSCSSSTPLTDSSFASWQFNGVVNQITNDANLGQSLEYNTIHSGCSYKSLEFNDILGDSFSLTLNITGLGTYNLNSSTLCSFDGYDGDKPYDIYSGTLTITEDNTNYIRGTFNFVGSYTGTTPTSTCNITQGSFKIHK